MNGQKIEEKNEELETMHSGQIMGVKVNCNQTMRIIICSNLSSNFDCPVTAKIQQQCNGVIGMKTKLLLSESSSLDGTIGA